MRAPLVHCLGSASGVLGTALIFVGLMTTNAATEATSVADGPTTIAANYATHRDDIRFGVALALGGVFLCLWFLGYLRQRIRATEPEGGWLSSVAFGGGVVGLTGLVGYLGLLVAATNDSIAAAPETARTLLVISWEYGGILAPAFAALVGATSLAIIRYSLLPRLAQPIAWLGLTLALGLALSGFLGGFLVVLALVWLFVIAVSFLVSATAVAVPRGSRAVQQAG